MVFESSANLDTSQVSWRGYSNKKFDDELKLIGAILVGIVCFFFCFTYEEEESVPYTHDLQTYLEACGIETALSIRNFFHAGARE